MTKDSCRGCSWNDISTARSFPGYNSAAQTRRVDQRYDHAIAHAKTKLIHILNQVYTRSTYLRTYVRMHVCNVHTSHWPTTESLSLSLSLSLSIILIFPSLSRQLPASIPLFWTVALHNCDTQPVSCRPHQHAGDLYRHVKLTIACCVRSTRLYMNDFERDRKIE